MTSDSFRVIIFTDIIYSPYILLLIFVIVPSVPLAMSYEDLGSSYYRSEYQDSIIARLLSRMTFNTANETLWSKSVN